MPCKSNNPFSTKNICHILVKKNLLSEVRVKEILKKKDIIKKKLEKHKEPVFSSNSSHLEIVNPVTIIDVIVSMNLSRPDKQTVILDEDAIFYALAEEWGFSYKKIDPLKLDLNLVTTTIPRSFAMKHLVLPIGIHDGILTVAVSDPFNTELVEDIAKAINMSVNSVLSSKSDIIRFINEFFGFKSSIAAAEHQFAAPAVDLGNLEQYVHLKSADELPSNDQHIVNAVNHIFSYAFDQRASDVHIEPKRNTSRVRMRIDGVLHTIYEIPKTVHSAVVSRIKNLSRLDMAEKRRPQDGRIKTEKGGVDVEMRISTIPVAFGEKVVMRIMDPDVLFQELEELGFTSTDLIRYNRCVNMPHGIILVCGPTGSGKTTTLYSTLRHLSSPAINITTIEDPIEMVNEEFNQIAVQPVLGITFSTILRNILRQDPDIIMIGEVRDLETAENAVQAAMTGHLVLSTLHTNDAPSTIIRLLDLGVPAFLIKSTIVGIVAQRLVRKICTYCKESFEINASELENMGVNTGRKGSIKLCRGKGCIKCRGTGYMGRTSIFEILPFSDSIRAATTQETDLETIRAIAVKDGIVSLRDNAVKKMLQGQTTCQEVIRATWSNTG